MASTSCSSRAAPEGSAHSSEGTHRSRTAAYAIADTTLKLKIPTPEIAKQVGHAAEHFRKQLAIEWLGQELPRAWAVPCPIKVNVGQIAASGQTT